MAPGEVNIDIWNMPWQHLKPAIMAIAVRKRNSGISDTRTFCGSNKEIDISIMQQVIHSLGEVEQKIYAHIATGAFWHEQQLSEIKRSDGKCKTLWERSHKHRSCFVGMPHHQQTSQEQKAV